MKLSRACFNPPSIHQAYSDQHLTQKCRHSATLSFGRWDQDSIGKTASQQSASKFLPHRKGDQREGVLRTNSAGGFQHLGTHASSICCSSFPSNRRPKAVGGARVSQRAQACADNSPSNERLDEHESFGSNDAQSGELPSVSGAVPTGDHNENGGAPESREQKNHHGNINWRRLVIEQRWCSLIAWSACFSKQGALLSAVV